MKNDREPNYMWGAQVTSPDGRYLALYVSRDTARVSSVSSLFVFIPKHDHFISKICSGSPILKTRAIPSVQI